MHRRKFDSLIFFLAITVSCNMLITPVSALSLSSNANLEAVTETDDEESEDPVTQFVERLYNIALDRKSDEGGLEFWTGKLKAKEMTGADCVRGFLVDTPEFSNRALSNEDVVETLYNTILDRESEKEGREYWIGRLEDGTSIREVIELFIDSPEWCNLCASYGIRSGAVNGKATKPSDGAKAMVAHLYLYGLRKPIVEDEVDAFSLKLTNQEMTVAELARDFFLGKDIADQNLSNEAFVGRIYAACLFRSADADGKAYWASLMEDPANTRYQILVSLLESPEFMALCEKFNLDAGSLERSDDPLAKKYVEPVIEGGERWYDGFVDPRTVRAELMQHPEDITVLVNKYHSVPLDYVPELVYVDHSDGQRLRPEAAEAWEKLYQACKSATGQSLYMISGYRTEETQRASFYRAIERYNVRTASRFYAWPGRSEHPLGLAMDICTTSNMNKQEFINTSAGEWMLEHGHEYGFIWRYPDGYSDVTGIAKEAWHFRYVGVDVATDMYNKGIKTLEEYYGERG